MTEYKEKNINIAIGEALMCLLNSKSDISAESLSAQLRRLAEEETDETRRQSLTAALKQIIRLSAAGGGGCKTGWLPEGVVLPSDATRH